MLATLPPELQRQIVESTIPHTFHTRTYFERQSTLRSLCLVSHGFRQIAQPLLFEIVWIPMKSRTGLAKRLKDEETPGSDMWGNTRCLVFSNHQPDLNGKLSTFLGLFPLVRQVNLYSKFEVDVSVFQALQHLSELQLHVFRGTRLTNLPRSVLSTVRSLTLVAGTPSTMAALLNPTVLPNLAVFALITSDQASREALADPQFDRLLPQLEALFFHHHHWALPRAAFLRSFAKRTLIDISSGNIEDLHHSDFAIVNARIYKLIVDDPTEAFFTKLDHLASFFEKSQPSLPLRLLYLDVSLEPTSSTPPRLQKYINRLATACRERKVEIVFEKDPCNYQVDFYISPDFVRRQKERTYA